jgi:2-polyprenyl-3-methyl-5-hydroxy-6-metoxy-1,4-benzoquinol methylase
MINYIYINIIDNYYIMNILQKEKLSLHRETTNTILYNNLMKAYIYKSIESNKFKKYKNIFTSDIYTNSIKRYSENINNNYKLIIPLQKKIPDIKYNNIIITYSSNSINHIIEKIITDKNIIFTFPRELYLNYDRDLFTFFMGSVLNKLRLKIPNIVYTIGSLQTYNEQNNLFHVIYENVKGIKLSDYLENEKIDTDSFYTIILQLCFTLQKAQDKLQFIHNSLYDENIILRNNDASFDLSTVIYNFENQSFSINVKDFIPTIIDLSSARIIHKGFAISYFSNPTIFTPGIDLCKLISSCLARLSKNKIIFENVKWINEFFNYYFDINILVEENKTYDEIFTYYKGFNLSQNNPISNFTPMDFINWFRQRDGELFNKLVKVSVREMKDKKILISHIDQQNAENKSLIKFINTKSGIIKSYISSKYNANEEEKNYDKQLIKLYNDYTITNQDTVYTINYNFPLDELYDSNTLEIIDYLSILPELKIKHKILNNYIKYLRIIKTLKLIIPISKENLDILYIEKEKIKYNISIIENLPLYRFYMLSDMIERTIQDGNSLIILKENLPKIIKELYPKCSNYIDNVIIPKMSNITIPEKLLYYSPCTLNQFNMVYRELSLINLLIKTLNIKNDSINKSFLQKILTQYIDNNYDDIKILLNLRQYSIPFESKTNRGNSRANDINKLLKDLINNNISTNFTSYLDFGGSDGIISSAVSEILKIKKENAYSIDVESWFDRQVIKNSLNVTFMTIKENQPIRLADKSIDIITCFQVLHHIKNIDFVLRELSRICNGVLIIREHNCENDIDRMIIDLEHSLFEITIESKPNIKFLNDYEAWYKSKKEWINILSKYGFRHISNSLKMYSSPTKYYYDIFIQI